MSIDRWQRFLTAPHTKNATVYRFWFGLSLMFAAIYGWHVLQQAFIGEYVASDDARQHVFWMQRFIDPELFPNDLIADYFQSVAPVGYSTFYRLFAMVGIAPLLLSKLLPCVLGIVAAGYCFVLCLEIFPVPAAGFIASLLFEQNLWMWDDLASATPRAFLHPIFLAFLYYFVRESLSLCLLSIVFLGGFYPQYLLVVAGVCFLSLWGWENGRIKWNSDRRKCQFYLSCFAVAFLVLVAYALKSSEFGPTIALAEAKTLPEFLPGGRSRFFEEDFGRYWLTGERSGIQPTLDPPLLCTGLLLPFLLRFGDRFWQVEQVKPSVRVLLNITLSALFCFFTAHALLFKLHLPGRYTHHSLRVVFSISAAIVLVVLLNTMFEWVKHRSVGYRLTSLCVASVILLHSIVYPNSLSDYPKTNYEKIGNYPKLYQFFEQKPKDIKIASLSIEASNIPIFSHRSILVGYEYAIPYHLGYYDRFRERTFALIRAQYTTDLTELKQFIQKYKIDFWVIDDLAFQLDYLKKNPWIAQYRSLLAPIKKNLKNKTSPALERSTQECTIHRFRNLLVVPTSCILEASKLYRLQK
ncbi:MAG: hypothetical protein WBC69_00600 [Geitlerinemataceae cyanobacterium]